jgi:hypothetical protein
MPKQSSRISGRLLRLAQTSVPQTGDSYQLYQNGTLIGALNSPSYDYTYTATTTPDNFYVVVTNGTAICASNVISITPKPASCCVPAGAYTILPNDLVTAPNIITPIDASLYGGIVLFNGNYNIHGSLQFKNGTFYFAPGTVFTIDQTSTGLSYPYPPYTYIHVLNATLYMGGAVLTASVPSQRWGGVFAQGSTIYTDACNVRSEISHSYMGISFFGDSPNTFPNWVNTNHYYINNTDFRNQYWWSIWDDSKASLLPGVPVEGITNCNFYSTLLEYPWAILLTQWQPTVTGTLEIAHNNIDSFNEGVFCHDDYAVIEHNNFTNSGSAIEINMNHSNPITSIVRNNIIQMDPVKGRRGIFNDDGSQSDISDNTIIGGGTGSGVPGRGMYGIDMWGTCILRNNTISNTGAAIANTVGFITTNTFDYIDNTLTKNNVGVYVNTGAFNPLVPVRARCNTLDNSALSGISYGIFVQQQSSIQNLGTPTNPNGNAFKGFNGLTNFPVQYDGTNALSFKYYKYVPAPTATPPATLEKDIKVTTGIAHSPVLFPSGALPSAIAPGCSSGFGVGLRIAASSPLSAEDSVNAAMDSLRFQLGEFRKMKTWQGEILSWFEKSNNLEGLYSYCDTLKGCNLEAYNTFMLYLMNKYDQNNQCSKAHDCANDVLSANPNDAEIQARTTYFNYSCRQRHGGGTGIILPFMPMNPLDSADLIAVVNSGTSLSEAACRKLQKHSPSLSCNVQNTYTPNYPDCGPECKKKKEEFLKKGWEKATGFKADKQGGQLSQNIPNPAENETVIPYLIPADNFESAYISVLSLTIGNEVKRIELSQAGYGQINLNLEGLSSGVYTYTLIVNGIKQDIKRMVIVK